jgi:C4-dicarboxylate-specific signal transduction histidine kinase
VLCQYGDVPASALDKQRLVQILVNLIANAAQAMGNVPEPSRRLTLGTSLVQSEGGERLRITVRDEGEGIAPENLTSIFAHGFTTRKSGHGFGLHSSALAAMEMGGKLTVQSDGPGLGAVFTLEMPINRTGLG